MSLKRRRYGLYGPMKRRRVGGAQAPLRSLGTRSRILRVKRGTQMKQRFARSLRPYLGEAKHFDYTLAATNPTDTPAAITAMLQIPSGPDVNERIGNKIFLKGVTIKLQIIREDNDGWTPEYLYMALCTKYTGSVTATDWAAGATTQFQWWTSFFNTASTKNKIIWRYYKRLPEPRIRGNGVDTSLDSATPLYIKAFVPIGKYITYESDATASPIKNGVGLVHWSSEALGGPTVSGVLRWHYRDA